MSDFDLTVIGGGPGGYVAALEAARRGAKVALVEEKRVGGVCLNRGCIPTKAMLESVATLLRSREAEQYGIHTELKGFDYGVIKTRREKVVDQLVSGVEFLLQKRKVEVLSGRGFLSDKNTVLVTLGNDHKELRTKSIILATGSRPQSIPGCEIDNKNILDSDGLLALDAPPKSLIVVGAGAVGCEWAQIMHALGCKVTVVEMLETLLPAEDVEVGKLLARTFRKWGIDTHTGSAIASVAQDGNGVTATLADGTTISAEKLLLSVGRKPNFENLWDPELNIQGTPKGVRATEHMRTTLPNVFAIGDLIGAPLLAHKASAEGRIAAENALGGRSVMGYMIIPACTFTFPEVASVGLTEARAREQGLEVRVGSFQFRANGKALAMGETEGFVKLIASTETDVLLGGTVVGPHASDLIMEIAMGLKFGGDFLLMEQTVHPHPTLSEALHEALGDLTGSAIHKIKV